MTETIVSDNKSLVSVSNLTAGRLVNGTRADYRLVYLAGQSPYTEDWVASVVASAPYGSDGRRGADRPASFPTPALHVVIRFVKPGLSAEDHAAIQTDIETLRQINTFRSKKALSGEVQSLVPDVYEVTIRDTPDPAASFIVESSSAGIPVDRLMRERPFVNEVEALQMASQMCELVEALQACAGKSGCLCRMKHLVWDSQKRRLFAANWSIPDASWTVRPDTEPAQVCQLLYRLLFKIPAPELDPHCLQRQSWSSATLLSYGVRQILARGLHINPGNRFHDIHELRHEVEHLISLWAMKQQELIMTADALLDEPPATDRLAKNNHRQSAATLLNLVQEYRRKEGLSSQPISTLCRSASALLQNENLLAAGIEELRAGSFAAAVKTLERCINEAWNAPIALAAARWKAAAQGLQQLRKASRGRSAKALADALTRVQHGLMALDEFNPAQAQTALGPLLQARQADSLSALVDDARIMAFMVEALAVQSGRHAATAATTLYRNVDALLGTLPYGDILRDALGNPGIEAQRLEQQELDAIAVGTLAANVKEAYQKSDAAGHASLREALAARTQDQLSSMLAERMVTDLLHERRYDTALAAAKVGMELVPVSQRLNNLYLAACFLKDARHAWLGLNLEALKNVIEAFRFVVDDAADWLLLFFYGCFDDVVAENDYARSRFLLDAFPWLNEYPDVIARVRDLILSRRDMILTQLELDRNIGLAFLRENLEKARGADTVMNEITLQIVKYYLHEQQFEMAHEVAACASEMDTGIAEYGALAQKLSEAQRLWEAGNVDGLRTVLEETARLEYAINRHQTALKRGGLVRLLT
jgi:hypothetical protein